MFRHPNYYKELRKRALDERNRDLHVRPISGSVDSATDQAISPTRATAPSRRATGPGFKQQAIDETVPHCDIEEAASAKPQAPSDSNSKPQASSDKQQASSSKPQASSSKI
jgi:hypothetical protein